MDATPNTFFCIIYCFFRNDGLSAPVTTSAVASATLAAPVAAALTAASVLARLFVFALYKLAVEYVELVDEMQHEVLVDDIELAVAAACGGDVAVVVLALAHDVEELGRYDG